MHPIPVFPEDPVPPKLPPYWPSNMTLTLPHLMDIPSWHQCPSKVAPALGGEPHFTWWVALADTGNLPSAPHQVLCHQHAWAKSRAGPRVSHTGASPTYQSTCRVAVVAQTQQKGSHSLYRAHAPVVSIGHLLHKANFSSLGDIDDIHDT